MTSTKRRSTICGQAGREENTAPLCRNDAAALKSRRGAALAIAIGTALIASIGAYIILFVATNQARLGRTIQERTSAYHLAESGIVVAMERLARDPNYPTGCVPGSAATTTERIDVNGDGAAAPDPQVTVTVDPCGAGRNHTIHATVTY